MEQLFGKTNPSLVKDPFNAKFIESVSMRCYRAMFTRKLEFVGYVEFKNGETEGKQRFTACNFSELYTKIANFCKSIEDYGKE